MLTDKRRNDKAARSRKKGRKAAYKVHEKHSGEAKQRGQTAPMSELPHYPQDVCA